MSKTQHSLSAALRQLQQRHITLQLTARSVSLWSPNTRVPSVLRRTILEHKAEIRAMIEACRIEVCPSTDLHRQEWNEASATCAACKRLAGIGQISANISYIENNKSDRGIERRCTRRCKE